MVERLWNGIEMEYDGAQFRLSTDSMVLADFADFPAKGRVADLGCGCGALALLLCGKYPEASVLGVELQEAPARMAAENARRNGLDARFQVQQADLREHRALLPHDAFDGVIANPPYYPVDSGKTARSEALADARSERTCTLEELCNCAAWMLHYGGRFCLVHKPERLAELLWQLRQCRIEPKRLRLVRHNPDADTSLVLVEGRLGGRPGLRIEKDLTLFRADGSPTADYRRIYHQED